MDDKPRKVQKGLAALAGATLLIGTGFALKHYVFRDNFLYAGTVEATKVDVPARVASVISSLDVREGETVSLNQSLLTLSCEDYKIQNELAKQNYDRISRLYKQDAQPQEAYEQAKSRLDDTSLKVGWCSVTAPIAGTVLNKYHESGEMVEPGAKLFTLADLSKPYAYIYVPQPVIAKVSLGERLSAYLPELNMRPFDGTVVEIRDEAEFTPKNVQTQEERTRLVYGIKVEFHNEEAILKPGMSVEVKLPEKQP